MLRGFFTVATALAMSMAPGMAAHAAGRSRATTPPTWSLDPARTTIAFSIDATGFPRTDGVFRRFEGSIGVDFAHPERSHVTFRVAADSIDVGSDLLGEMLRGRAFLDVERHADISFTSREVEKRDEHSVRVTGDLTLLGVTRPLSVDVEVRRLDGVPRARLALSAKAQIDRLAYGMREGYPLISRTVDFAVASEVVEKAARTAPAGSKRP